MFQSIISILTTVAVALHAMLGCCSHHAHACETDGGNRSVQHSHTVCSHGHHESDEHEPRDNRDSDGHDRDQNNGHRHSCDEGDCSFAPASRVDDFDQIITLSAWSQSLGEMPRLGVTDNLRPLHLAAQGPPDSLTDSGSVRATSQIWRL